MKIEITDKTTNEEFRQYVLYLQGEVSKKDELISSFKTKEQEYNKTIEDKEKSINDLKVKNYDLYLQIPQSTTVVETNNNDNKNVVGKKSITDLTNKMEV